MKESFKMVTRKHEKNRGCDLKLFSKESADKIREFHKSFPVYAHHWHIWKRLQNALD